MLQKNKKLYKLSKLRLDYFEKLNKPLTINESELGVKSIPSLTKESSVTILYRKFYQAFKEMIILILKTLFRQQKKNTYTNHFKSLISQESHTKKKRKLNINLIYEHKCKMQNKIFPICFSCVFS